MSRSKRTIPSYRLHNGSGQAIVTIDGVHRYLGKHGSDASYAKYDRLIAEWLANGRSMPKPDHPLTIAELADAFTTFADEYYRDADGSRTHEVTSIEYAIRPLIRLYAELPAQEFGPTKLRAVREKMIQSGWTRANINRQVSRIIRMFKWAAGRELIPPDVHSALSKVDGLKRGRTDAVESPGVKPVAWSIVERTLPYMSSVVRTMVLVQYHAAMRPGEVVAMRSVDIDTSARLDDDPDKPIWLYTPQRHKNAWRGHSRTIPLGPKCQQILQPLMANRPINAFLFSPSEAMEELRASRRANRQTPEGYGNGPGTNVKRKPRWEPGECYDPTGYAKAVRQACDRAFEPPAPFGRRTLPSGKLESVKAQRERLRSMSEEQKAELAEWRREHRWSPGQLRHSMATEVRKRYGLIEASKLLGHKDSGVTMIYAERDVLEAARISMKVG